MTRNVTRNIRRMIRLLDWLNTDIGQNNNKIREIKRGIESATKYEFEKAVSKSISADISFYDNFFMLHQGGLRSICPELQLAGEQQFGRKDQKHAYACGRDDPYDHIQETAEA